MKFLADENFPKPISEHLQRLGHDVKTVQRKQLQSTADITISQFAIREKRVLLTYDKGFLAFEKFPKELSVIVFRFPKLNPKDVIPFVTSLLPALQKKKKPFKLEFSREYIARIQNA